MQMPRANFSDEPLKATIWAICLVLVGLMLAVLYAETQRPHADAMLAGKSVESLHYLQSLTQDALDPQVYAQAVLDAQAPVDQFLNSDSAVRMSGAARAVERGYLAYTTAYWVWLAEGEGGVPVSSVRGAEQALEAFPEFASTVTTDGGVTRIRDFDGALNTLWSIGALETEAAKSEVARTGATRWTAVP